MTYKENPKTKGSGIICCEAHHQLDDQIPEAEVRKMSDLGESAVEASEAAASAVEAAIDAVLKFEREAHEKRVIELQKDIAALRDVLNGRSEELNEIMRSWIDIKSSDDLVVLNKTILADDVVQFIGYEPSQGVVVIRQETPTGNGYYKFIADGYGCTLAPEELLKASDALKKVLE